MPSSEYEDSDHGSPVDTGLPVDPLAYPTEPRRSAHRAGRRQQQVVFAAVLLLAVPLAWGSLKREIAGWYGAAAKVAEIAGDKEKALRQIDNALAWDGENIHHLMQRCFIKLSTGDARNAIDDADHALRLARAAAADRLDENSALDLINALNSRAYTYALAEVDLESALANIDEAIQMVGRGASPELLDTRAYVNYLLGEYESGLVDAEAALESYDEVRRVERNRRLQSARVAIDKRPWEHAIQNLDQALAVFHQHRGLLYQALGREEEAEQDLQRAVELGYDPENGVW